jgi:hypothetical protein
MGTGGSVVTVTRISSPGARREDAVILGRVTRPRTSPRPKSVTFDAVRAIALALPGVEEGTSYGTPAFKVAGKLLARLREDGETLVVRVEMDARDMIVSSEPETFFVTDHYAGHPWVLVHLARVERAALGALLEEAWRTHAPRRLRAAAGGEKAPPAPAPKKRRATPEDPLARLRAICLALPETTEGENHGHPCFEVRSKTFVMFMDNHHGDGRVAIWCKAPPGAQATLVEADPTRYFVPPYVGPRGWLGARLDTGPDWTAVAACVDESWRMTAPKRLLAECAAASEPTRSAPGRRSPRTPGAARRAPRSRSGSPRPCRCRPPCAAARRSRCR